jgi:hypothetical protein
MVLICSVACRPSATFLVLEPLSDAVPQPGAYCAEVEFGGVRASSAVTVVDEDHRPVLWCQPRGPLPRAGGGESVLLRFGPA